MLDFDAPLRFLGGLSPRQFLAEHWQKKPLLVRGGCPEAAGVVTPDGLKRLAQRDDLVSRLVLQDGGDYDWELRHGPFSPRELRTLRGKWALLVQEVDRVNPAARALLDPLGFMPRWRLDDVMVSLAPAGSGVGAHVDNYDVFLIQGLGRRRWRIGNAPVEDDAVLDGLDVSVLRHFEWTDEHELAPGDLLYLPPRVAHEGVALDECLTLSIGFRAPAHVDLVGGLLEDFLLSLPADAFYADPDLAPTAHPGEIAPEAVARARQVVVDLVTDEARFRDWFGRHLTTSRRSAAFPDEGFDLDEDALDVAEAAAGDGALGPEPDLDDADDGFEDAPDAAFDSDALDAEADGEDEDDADLDAEAEAVAGLVRSGLGLRHADGSRLAFVRHPDGEASLFADGQTYGLEADLAFAAPLLADRRQIPAADLLPHLDTPDFAVLLAALLDAGALDWDTAEGA